MVAQAAMEMWSRTEASTSSSDGFTVSNRFVRGYTVVTDPTDDEDIALTAPNMPARGSQLPGTSAMFVKDKRATRISPIFWMVLVTWEGEVGPGDGQGGDPWDQKPKQSWHNVITQEPVDRDRFDKPILNAVNEPIEGVMVQLADWVLRVERNYRTLSLPGVHAYLHSVNSDTIQTSLGAFAPGVAKLQKFEPTPDYGDNGNVIFWKVKAEIGFRYPWRVMPAQAWMPRKLNQGYSVRTPDGRIVLAKDSNESNVSRPILLKPDGTQAVNPDDSEPIIPDLYAPLPYAALGLF